ncbi:MAG: CRISPR-associated protein Csd1 [Paraglaciecola sp.]|jgi:CRISPR-associated protein Csd1
MAKLYETYEEAMTLDLPNKQQLMPISHTLQNAHINVVISGDGNFIRAAVLEKTQVFLPATEKSAGRSSGISPHSLADKIQYVAGDYSDFGGLKKSGFNEYKALLTDWCESAFTHPAAQAVLQYVSKATMVADLIKHNILYAQNNTLLTKWSSDEEQPKLFRVLPKDKSLLEQGSALVCWSVEISGDAQRNTWLDKTLQQSWINFDTLNSGQPSLCLVTGKQAVAAVNHPAKIRHSGDKAKLISSNDTSGFTFRGKFLTSQQASNISFDVTQKAHNALRWLVSRQGFRNGNQAFVSWAISGQNIPDPMKDPWAMFSHNADYIEPKKDNSVDIGQSYANRLTSVMARYLSEGKLKPHDDIAIIGIDSATPGRMGVIYYRKTIAKEFLATITQWHLDFAWPQRHKKEVTQTNKKAINYTIWPLCAPAPKKIIKAVYGENVTDSLKKNIIERLMPCIIEGKPLPIDMVNYAIKRATNRVAYKRDESWLWEQNLGIACALYKGYCKRTNKLNERKDYDMALEEGNRSRDYLYGRLLAVAENIELYALYKVGEKGRTSAERMMQRFADRPCSTWRNLELSLQSYMYRLQNSSGGFIQIRKDLLDEILGLFHDEDFTSEKKLSGEFLLGFHCQRLVLNAKK